MKRIELVDQGVLDALDATQNAIDELWRFIGGQLPDVHHGFCHGYCIGNVIVVQQLPDTDAQCAAVNRWHALDGPVLDVAFENFVNAVQMGHDAFDDRQRVLVEYDVRVFPSRNGYSQRINIASFSLKQEFQGSTTGFGACSH